MQATQGLNKTLLSKHADIFNTVKAWDNGGLTMDRYTVVIGDDVWFMSNYPAYPNGVCMYGGECPTDYNDVYLGKPISLDKLPTAVLEQILVLAKEATCLTQ